MTTCFLTNLYFSKTSSVVQKCRLRRLISENTRKSTSDMALLASRKMENISCKGMLYMKTLANNCLKSFQLKQHLNNAHKYAHIWTTLTMFCVHSFSVFFSLCLFDLQLLFLNTCQKVINGVGWPDDCHGLSPILYDTAPAFIYTDQLLCHCVFICSNFR